MSRVSAIFVRPTLTFHTINSAGVFNLHMHLIKKHNRGKKCEKSTYCHSNKPKNIRNLTRKCITDVGVTAEAHCNFGATSQTCVEGSQRCIHAEEDKGFMVADTDTVIHPGAVVIHS